MDNLRGVAADALKKKDEYICVLSQSVQSYLSIGGQLAGEALGLKEANALMNTSMKPPRRKR